MLAPENKLKEKMLSLLTWSSNLQENLGLKETSTKIKLSSIFPIKFLWIPKSKRNSSIFSWLNTSSLKTTVQRLKSLRKTSPKQPVKSQLKIFHQMNSFLIPIPSFIFSTCFSKYSDILCKRKAFINSIKNLTISKFKKSWPKIQKEKLLAQKNSTNIWWKKSFSYWTKRMFQSMNLQMHLKR